MAKHIIYECGICGCYHPWCWEGDCRDDDNSFAGPEDYVSRSHRHVKGDKVEIRTMEDRLTADLA